MKVEIGPGCKRCDQLYENTVSAVSDLGSPADIEVTKVKDVDYFTKMGVFMRR
jgi:hypothetical protein